MNPTEHRYPLWLAQALSVAFLSLYAYLTQPLYSDNYLWLGASAVLFVYALVRKPGEAMLVSSLALLAYGAYQLYRVYSAEEPPALGWNELIWLGAFPFMAAMGGIGKLAAGATAYDRAPSLYDQLQGTGDGDEELISSVDETYDYLGGTAFLFKLEEEVLRALRERRKFTLLIVEIEHFRSYKRMFGYDKSQLLLNNVAEAARSAPGAPPVRGHLGDGLFGLILPHEQEDGMDPLLDAIARYEDSLNDAFFSVLHLRPRREGVLKLRLSYGQADCPVDGIEARALLEKAQSDLDSNGEQPQ